MASKLAWLQFGVASLGAVGLLLGSSVALWLTVLIGGCWLLAVGILAATLTHTHHHIRIFFEHLRRARLTIFALLGIWVILLWGDRVKRLPPLELYIPFAGLWVWLVIGYLLSISHPEIHRSSRLVKGIGQAVISLTISLIVLEILLRLFAGHLDPDLANKFVGIRVNEHPEGALMPPQIPVHNYWWAGTREDYVEDFSRMDLYRATCLDRPDQDPEGEPYRVVVEYDQYGFRGDITSQDVDVVVLGDSFTHAGRIPEPYWYGIAPKVYGMGASTTGNIEQTLNLEAIGLDRSPEVVIMGFFEGNDLQDNLRFQQVREAYDPNKRREKDSLIEENKQLRPLRFLATYSTAVWVVQEFNLQEALQGGCIFPIEDKQGNQLTFLPDYTSMATIPTDDLRQSYAVEITRQTILEAAQMSQANGATFILMFIPTTLHTYWHELDPADIRLISENTAAFAPTVSGFVVRPRITDPDEITRLLTENIDNQRVIMREIAEEAGILFLDLTPFLQAQAARGEQIYFYGDTHFNRNGHRLAREALVEFLAEHNLLMEVN
jgi:hypothetical protein